VLFAGNLGGRGNVGGMGAQARFASPNGVAIDSAGNVYVADTLNYTIRRITTDGAVRTWVGAAGASGSADGTGLAARFASPSGVDTDTTGNVYVADGDNNTIRKITSTGVVSTLAGMAGTLGYADGTGGDARFDHPFGVATDGAGNVFVADTSNETIRKITPSGVSGLWFRTHFVNPLRGAGLRQSAWAQRRRPCEAPPHTAVKCMPKSSSTMAPVIIAPLETSQ